jgi:hypothetical protein
MAETLRFIYTVILFVSLFIVVTVGQSKLIIIIYILFYSQSFTHFSNISLIFFYNKGKCNTDQECYKKYPNAKPGSMTCFGGICSSLIGGGPRVRLLKVSNKKIFFIIQKGLS